MKPWLRANSLISVNCSAAHLACRMHFFETLATADDGDDDDDDLSTATSRVCLCSALAPLDGCVTDEEDEAMLLNTGADGETMTTTESSGKPRWKSSSFCSDFSSSSAGCLRFFCTGPYRKSHTHKVCT